MKVYLAAVAVLFALLGHCPITPGQKINFPFTLPLYNDFLPALEESAKTMIGANVQVNDHQGFDGSVVQLALRTKPFAGKQNGLARLETGLLVNGYFNKRFYWADAQYGGVFDMAWDGYDFTLFFNQPFAVKGVTINLSAAPRLNLIYANSLQFYQGKYYFDNKAYWEAGDYWGGALSLSGHYKAVELWASYHYNPLENKFVDWQTSQLSGNRYLLEPSKTYWFRTSHQRRGHSIFNLRYGIAWNKQLAHAKAKVYYFSDTDQYGGGIVCNYGRLVINPEYSVFPAYFALFNQTGHQLAGLLRYRTKNGLQLHYALQYTRSVAYTNTFKSNAGVDFQF